MSGATRQTQRADAMIGAATFKPAFHAHWERATAPELLIALAVIGAPLAIGGVHLVTRIALAITLVVAFAWGARRLTAEGRRVRVGLVGWGLALALLVTFFQLLPLPAAVVEVMAPGSFEARVAAAALTGEAAPGWMPLSLDQGRTAAAFVSLSAVLFAYLGATGLRHDSSATHRMIAVVEVAALLVLAVGALQALLGIEAIFGSYEASVDTAAVPFLTTFVNPNHAAALMLLGALVAFGASLSPEREQRWHLPVGVALSVGVLATMSRANALLLIAGLVALTLPPLLSRRHRAARTRLVRLFVGALACLFVAVVLIGPERWLAELASLGGTDFVEQGLVRECWRIGADVAAMAPGVGVGNGAFVVAAAGHTVGWSVGLVAYAHMGALQVVAELGWPAGLAVLGLVAAGFVVVFVRARADLAVWGAVVGLGALALQNGVDFSLWLPGVGVPAAVTLGLVVQATWPEGARRASRWLHSSLRWPLPASAALVGALIVTVPVAWRERPEAWQGEARAALAANAPTSIDRSALIAAHPHDFVAWSLAAALAERNGRRDEAARHIERALALAPTEPATIAAAVRSRTARGDVSGASALVDRLDALWPDGRRRALEIVLEARRLPGAEALMEAYFAGDAGRIIDADRALADGGDGEGARRLLAWGFVRHPDDPRLYEAFGARTGADLATLERLATDCLVKAGLAADGPARARWERLGYHFQGRVAAARRHDREALALFLASAELGADPRGLDRVGALLEAGKAAARLEDAAALGQVVETLGRIGPSGAWSLGEYHFLRSRQAELAGKLDVAIREMHEVLRHLGHVAGFHDRLADLFYRTADAAAGDRARARARAIEASAK
ncbi:MAG: hypothetical protein IT385_03670 [Deltaproteobacteria bacterium]|nr:hypothetical protein [Deltaproteobacteria bacterium]